MSCLLSRILHPKRAYAAVGDIHGCYAAAKKAIEIIELTGMQGIFLGDYLDRGPSSLKTIDLLISAKREHPDWIFLMGNHEKMLIDHIPSIFASSMPPTGWTAAGEYFKLGYIPRSHHVFLESLRLYWESKSLLFVHGGIHHYPYLPVEAQPLRELLWSYQVSPLWAGKKIVRGHQIVVAPVEYHTHINLNTGCGGGGPLTIGIIQEANISMPHLLGYYQVSPTGKLMNPSRVDSSPSDTGTGVAY